MLLKSYEIVYIFVTPYPPLTRRYLIRENVDNSARPLTTHMYVCPLRGGKITAHTFGGGAKTWRMIIEVGHVLSASDFRNSTAPRPLP